MVNSNHGTFYYNQLAALQVLVGDNDGAKATVEDYFTGKYKAQIAADGDQVRVSCLHPTSLGHTPVSATRWRAWLRACHTLARRVSARLANSSY